MAKAASNTETSLTIKESIMPTFFTYKHKVVTPYGEMFIKTQEPANENGVDNWIKENQGSVNARFKDKAEGLP
ncbi:MAG: hypothetical protein IPH18_00585 [Chitinophagaceae bacterium]|nr:hypothetical protein [Chitinophagaceae bacterium]